MKNLVLLLFLAVSVSLSAQTAQWAHSLHGISIEGDYASKVSVDQEGNTYVSGSFYGILQFSNSDIELDGSASWGSNIYLYKKSPSGELIWAQYYGGSAADWLTDMTLDHNGNIYLSGSFQGSMDVGSGSNTITLTTTLYPQDRDGYIVKFAPNGDLLDAHSFGHHSNDFITAIGFDNDNNIILAGDLTGEIDFDLGQGTHIENCTGPTIVKYTEYFELISVHTMSSYFASIEKLEVNAADELIFGGHFINSLTLSSGEGVTGCPQGIRCGFVMSLTNTNEFNWVVGMTGNSFQVVVDMELSESGDIYIAGVFANTTKFKADAEIQTFESNSGSRDVYFAKISSAGSFEWIKAMGGEGDDFVTGFELGNNGDIYLAGTFAESMSFDTASDTAEYTAQGVSSSYLSIYNPEGEYKSTSVFNNPDGNAAAGIALNSIDDIHLIGWFSKTINFDPLQNGFEFSAPVRANYLLKITSLTVGIVEGPSEYPISIFPNPVRNELHIEAQNIEKLEVYTIHGKLVLSKSVKGFGDRHTIGVSNLPAGTYILSLTANGGFIGSEKFVVIR